MLQERAVSFRIDLGEDIGVDEDFGFGFGNNGDARIAPDLPAVAGFHNDAFDVAGADELLKLECIGSDKRTGWRRPPRRSHFHDRPR